MKKILVLSFTLIFATILILPVFAVSPKKIPVTISGNFDTFWFTPGDITISGNMKHCRDMTQGFGEYTITGDGISLVGYSEGTGDYNINELNGKGSIKYNINLVFPDGTFEGVLVGHGTFTYMFGYPFLVEGSLHLVAQGTEDYSGWTLTYTMDQDQVYTKTWLLIP